MRKRKYNNTKVCVDGFNFDSKREAHRYLELKMLEKEGVISDLLLQPRFELQETFKKNGKTFRSIVYNADFSYTYKGQTIVEDSKGMRTKDYIIKKKLFEKKYPDMSIMEV